MYSAASGWLMTSLNPSPLLVSLVQAATTLPMFLFALPAGALADILDRRRLLIAAEIAATVVSAIFALMVSLRLATPANLLSFVFLIGVASALTAPAWQAIVPQLVPRRDLQAAVAANSAGFNVSRAIRAGAGRSDHCRNRDCRPLLAECTQQFRHYRSPRLVASETRG